LVYVAFAFDLNSRVIVGWSTSTTKDVSFVEQCLQVGTPRWRPGPSARRDSYPTV